MQQFLEYLSNNYSLIWHVNLNCLQYSNICLLRSWVRIPPGAWMFVCCECCVLSGWGLCDELITHPEESYRLVRRYVWCRNLVNEEAMTRVGSQRHKKKKFEYISNKMQRYTVYFIWKLLYMFRVVPPPIIRSANNCIYSIWYLSDRYCYLSLERQVAGTVWQIPDAVDTVVCAPDDGWWYHPKHVEQFPEKINCVTLHLVGHKLEYFYDARTHKR